MHKTAKRLGLMNGAIYRNDDVMRQPPSPNAGTGTLNLSDATVTMDGPAYGMVRAVISDGHRTEVRDFTDKDLVP